MVCTHNENERGNKETVATCKTLDIPTCYDNLNCKFNFDEAPSKTPGICTHIESERSNWISVNSCKNQTKSACH